MRMMCILVVTAIAGPALQAQQPAFEVASVKISDPGRQGNQTQWDPGRLVVRGTSVKQLIQWAYQVTPLQISGGPSWLESKRFDIEAEAEGSHTKDELFQMLQPLLANRYKLALHREAKEQSLYVLTTGTNRSRLQDAQAGQPTFIDLRGTPLPDNGLTLEVIGQSVSMPYLVNYLTGRFARVVVDRTGLKGEFDFKVQVALDEQDLSDKQAAVATAMSNAMPLLGLKVDSAKGPVEILVIDHVEEPSSD
jgi:uncharacterized protein (TIGR03435 family)